MRQVNRVGALALACAGVAITLACGSAQAQIGAAGVDGQQHIRLIPDKEVDRLVAPVLDFDQLTQQAIAREAAGGLPMRFASPWDIGATPENAGTWDNLDDTRLIWRLRVQSPGALSINFGFSTYRLPDGASLTLRSIDDAFALPAFTSADNNDHGELWTPMIMSDDVMLELVVAEDRFDDVQLEIGRISSGFRQPAQLPGGRDGASSRSGSCNLDVVCSAADGWPQVDDWRDEIPASGAYTVSGIDFCSGSLINNTANDQTAYFLTANHCGVGTSNDQSVVIYWNYENPTCRQPGSGASGTPISKTGFPFSSGTIHRASYSPSDFTLLEVADPLDPVLELTFAGWDRSGTNGTSAVGIHHPGVDEKRISFEDQPTTTTTYLQNAIPGDGTHERVTDWDIGTTEPGSSGSPLFNQDHRIIGQLHGGFASCSSQTSDWYGKVSVSWNGGGTSSSRLSDWLDPLGTGAMTVDTITGAGMQVTPATGTTHQGLLGGPFTPPSTDYTLSNSGPDPVDYEVSIVGGGTAPVLINGGTSLLSGTLSGGGGSTIVTVSIDASAAAALAAGSYSTDILFDDTTNARQEVRTHALEVGLTGIDVTPATDLAGTGPPGGPYGPSRTYTVTSTQPTPVDVLVFASDTWIGLDGATSPVSFTLNGVGDSQDVIVGFSSVSLGLPPGFYSGSVAFDNVTDGNGSTSRGVALDAGRLAVASTDIPKAITDNSSFSSDLIVTDDVEIGDLNLKVDITHTYIGDLIVELQSPTGTIVRLHDRTGGSTDNLITTYDDDTNAPDGPGLLADYNGESALGTWTLFGSDNAGGDQGSLNSWTLLIGASTLPPPDCIGDLTGDNRTDVLDFSVFAANFGQSVPPNTGGDMDGNGIVDVLDFSIFSANFGCPF